MRLHQYWLHRYSTAIVAGVATLLFMYGAIEGDVTTETAVLGGLVIAGPLLALTPRCILGGVEFTDSELIVRGWLWSRRIERGAISAVNADVIVWTASSGNRRVTPLTMFWTFAGYTSAMRVHNENAVNTIIRWAAVAPTR